jgi:integrating conjugative element membrane protein (TIGR03747 family)
VKEPVGTAQRQQAASRGLLVRLLSLPWRLFGMLCASLLLSILVECVGLHLFWREQGWRHAEAMLDHELGQLSSQFTRSALVREPGRTAQRLVDGVQEWLFVKSGLQQMRLDAANTQATSPTGMPNARYYLGQGYVWIENYLLAAVYTTLTFLVRLLVLALSLPLLLLAAFVGLVDGLVRRDIRRFGAGRESGFVYHRAKALLIPMAVLPGIVYLALPVSLHPLWILLPGAAGLGLVVNVGVGSFKKYL